MREYFNITNAILSWRFNTVNAILELMSRHVTWRQWYGRFTYTWDQRHSFSIRLMAWKWLQKECW